MTDDDSDALGAEQAAVAGALVLDVRRPAAFAQADTVLPGARWRDPGAIDTWAPALPAGCRVIVYCVHGHEVSRGTAQRLHAMGIDARFLRGGIDAWQTAGRPLQRKADTPPGG